ncbi:hypothetical protein SEVIR_7G100800v4 [Setaria viridis]|uniref:Uncharacterized protein n=1 Tax=Setaria viridis TaxID=4556 RepID=A0A4U6U2L2_SETVI|nr:hypothetical protein SEVIR_7G100800v2 [Setaria viridis]
MAKNTQPLLITHNHDDTGSSSSGELRGGEVRRQRSCGDFLPIGGGGGGGGGSSSSSGELRGSIARPGEARRRSCGDLLPIGGGGGGFPRGKPRHRKGGDEAAEGAVGYVSFEDVIGTAAFRDGIGRPPEAGISDPLVRTASRLYYAHQAPRLRHRRQRSPGPLGTRRGSAMHGLVKKYVHPFFSFIAGIFCCTVTSS